jgi:hypothetical protein
MRVEMVCAHVQRLVAARSLSPEGISHIGCTCVVTLGLLNVEVSLSRGGLSILRIVAEVGFEPAFATYQLRMSVLSGRLGTPQ